MVKDRFSYQDLRVYEDMIRSFSLAESIASRWDSVHAIVDHFVRASEGALVCLAEACRTRQDAARHEAAGYSLGSVLECAACFDIAGCKSLCNGEETLEVKSALCSVFRQLHALRSSWQAQGVWEMREDSLEYDDSYIFNHERLKAYQLGLEVVRQIDALRFLDRLPRADFRRIDEAATSIVLNIAEGNGRFTHLDHGRFLQMANRSNTKLAARLEMCALRGAINREQAIGLNRLLVRIDQMTARLAEAWRQE
jgi:four helix bundle protein